MPETPRPTILERLDLALAGRIAQRLNDEDSGPDVILQSVDHGPEHDERMDWTAGLMALRGFRISREDISRVVAGRTGRFRPEHQEFKLIQGFAEVLVTLEERATAGRSPDGWWLVEAFRRVTEGIDRFRNNTLRRDQPWDGLARVTYPDPAELGARLDRFHPDACFGDEPNSFAELHPVRQGVRAMWRFARISPFPDFNLAFSALAFGGHLLAHGYPPLLPLAGDRVRLERMVRGPAPQRSLALEARLLDQVLAPRASA